MKVSDRPVLVTGGPIRVMDEALSAPEAVLLADGKVAALGPARELEGPVRGSSAST